MRRLIQVAVPVLLVALVAVAVGLGWARERLRTPYRGWTGESVSVEVEPGSTATAVARRLEELGVLEDRRWLLLWLWWTDDAGSLHAGQYRFDAPRSVVEVAEVLTSGRVVLRAVTVPEGATRWQVARAIADAGFGSEEEALRATLAVDLIADLDPEADSLEGYLYPDTYLAPSSDGPREVVETMVDRFRALWNAARRRRARALGMSLREVVTLASLVEAETPKSWERPLVSAVFHNRLERGMRLQCDPTVLYAMRLEGRLERSIRRSDLLLDSPYNTYAVAGLPAGPIGNPREASLDAALRPADVDFLYFVSRNDGSHAFTRTLREHNRMVNRYQRSP